MKTIFFFTIKQKSSTKSLVSRKKTNNTTTHNLVQLLDKNEIVLLKLTRFRITD